MVLGMSAFPTDKLKFLCMISDITDEDEVDVNCNFDPCKNEPIEISDDSEISNNQTVVEQLSCDRFVTEKSSVVEHELMPCDRYAEGRFFTIEEQLLISNQSAEKQLMTCHYSVKEELSVFEEPLAKSNQFEQLTIIKDELVTFDPFVEEQLAVVKEELEEQLTASKEDLVEQTTVIKEQAVIDQEQLPHNEESQLNLDVRSLEPSEKEVLEVEVEIENSDDECNSADEKLIKLDMDTISENKEDTENETFMLGIHDKNIKEEVKSFLPDTITKMPAQLAKRRKKVSRKRGHKRKKHNGIDVLESGNYFKCSKCGYLSWRKSNVTQHITTVHSRPDLRCPHCLFVHPLQNVMMQHVRRHERRRRPPPPPGKMHKCSLCRYRTISLDNLNQHLAMHSVGTYKCNECSFSTKFVDNLTLHMEIHEVRAQMAVRQ